MVEPTLFCWIKNVISGCVNANLFKTCYAGWCLTNLHKKNKQIQITKMLTV